MSEQDPPLRAELVHESARSRVTRLFVAGGTIVRKEPLGADRERRLEHEVAMLERLRGVAGVAQLVEAPQHRGAIVLQDAGGVSLRTVERPLAVDVLIGLAVKLARAVVGMHQRGVMHRDIAPANIVISSDGDPCLVDFALSMSLAEIRPEFTHHSAIVGTLAYVAPEQSGRTGRSVDQRADLYALGATLYDLATGEPPFGSGDPLQLTHDHLARVPVAPVEVNPAIPRFVSEIVMHLLEKEPDNRYQSAEGVVYDLERSRHFPSRPPAAPLRIGEHDVPRRLLPPSRLVGREDEVARLQAAFEAALTGGCRGVLISGAAGVGKTVLVDELRPLVTGRDGWFVSGKFDQYRRDLEFDGINQALRALGRLLLAEPDDQLTEARQRILGAVSSNAGLLTAVVPEFAALLAMPSEPGDPLTAQVRAAGGAVQVLRAVASRKRTLVLFLDDLQWAGRAPLNVVDLVLSEEPVEGLLLVGAYREGSVNAAHPLAGLLSGWCGQAGVEHVRLANLPVSGSVTMAAEMLHVDPAAAAGLVEEIYPHTSGNPYATVELLNALRGDGVLVATEGGWRWDEVTVQARMGRPDVAALSAARLDKMPAPSRHLVEVMACLGGRVEISLVQIATAEPGSWVDQALGPALDEGVLVVEPGVHEAVRFRHDRIREVILGGLEPRRRAILRLTIARRLAEAPELFAAAADQYLPVVDAVDDAAERGQVVKLLRRAADQAKLTGDYALVNTLLAAALRLIDPRETATLVAVHTDRHAALYSIGRVDEADEEYRTIEGLSISALDCADATAVQVRSLTHRQLFPAAIRLGVDSLRQLGITVPAVDRLPVELAHQFDHLYRWLDHSDDADDLARPDLTDTTLLAATRLLNAVLPTAYFVDPSMQAWLSLEGLRIWIEHGSGPTVIAAAGAAGFAPVAMREDYAAGYRAVRRILALGEARGYEPDTAPVRSLLASLSCWFEPIEDGVQPAQRAREEAIAAGDPANAAYTYYATAYYLLDSASPLDSFVTDVEAGRTFVHRTGIEQTGQSLDSYHWLAGVLRGESAATAGETNRIGRDADNPLALFLAHVNQAIAAAIFGDPGRLTRHTSATVPLLPVAPGQYPTALARLLRGLACAEGARATDGEERRGLLSELDEVTQWLAARAADAPDNFLHMVRLLEAERAWTVVDFRAASLAFDAARRAAAQRQRPWHRALITERAARFYLAHGVEQVGYDLLTQARRAYAAWGATAKVAQLDWAYPTLQGQRDVLAADSGQPGDLPRGGSTVTLGTIDLLGILSASQALSSETSIERLQSRVVKVLSAMTGATGVHLVLWSEDRQVWLMPAPRGSAGLVPVSASGDDDLVPMSVLRYARRTDEPLVVDDATSDDRFARDPYFTDVACCSLVALPIFSRGSVQALLVLENRLIRGAFSTERLDAVKLIAGQLAVSLDNAQVYAEFRRIADEQAALRRVATLVARGVPAPEVFEAVANEARGVLNLDSGSLLRFESDGTATLLAADSSLPTLVGIGERLVLDAGMASEQVRSTGQPARVPAYGGDVPLTSLGYGGSVGAPVIVEGRLWGVLLASWAGTRAIPSDSEHRLVQFTELVGTAVANAESRAELAASRARVVATADETRRRIERDLHDGAQQQLVSLVLELRDAQEAMPPGLAAQLDPFVVGLNRALDELRELARGIHPPILAEGGLGPALNVLARRSAVPVEVAVRIAGRLPELVEIAGYYVVSEALTNATKHAQATAIAVTVEADAGDRVLRIAVRDDGVGGADFARGTGLVGLKDRVEALSGRILLDSAPGRGTRLKAELPLPDANLVGGDVRTVVP